MAVKKTGISHDLIIHPGETISDVLEERGISQAELASRTGVSAAYMSNVIAGKKDISAKLAMGLEYALGVPKSFWLNLQSNYEAELMEANEEQTISDEERSVREDLKEVVKHLRKEGVMPQKETNDASILSLRKALQISDISNLNEMIPTGQFRIANASINQNVVGAWVRLCQIAADDNEVSIQFAAERVDQLISELKQFMLRDSENFQEDLKRIMGRYGIDFSIVKNFRGAPVQGYIYQKKDMTYQMALTIRRSYADIFWFTLFHELGHIVNGDVVKATKFIDFDDNGEKEKAADLFASNKLLEPDSYSRFVNRDDFTIGAIMDYADSQNVMPYIVIGRLQKEKKIPYNWYSDYKTRYKWIDG